MASTVALVSVFNKTGVIEFCQALRSANVSIISTGGTAKSLTDNKVENTQVADVTGFPEVLDGRVKTLHPKIHAGLLARMDLEHHRKDLKDHDINPIQLVAVNLYPFEDTVAKPDTTLEAALEMIDIGGVAMIRAAAKNFAHVVILVDPSDYGWVAERIKTGGVGAITLQERKELSLKAFLHTSHYDTAISQYLATGKAVPSGAVTRSYEQLFALKYGVNPHQAPATISKIKDTPFPFEVFNGTPGYINLLDALNAWQLVKELRQATGLPAAASFKHVSPAGAAVAVPLTEEEKEVYDLGAKSLTPVALAYLRARQADPMCSFGDFAAVSDVVDEETAQILKVEVSDGIIAPGFDEKALEILRQKKNGAYIVIKADPNYEAPDVEYREVYGVVFAQKRNNALITPEHITKQIISAKESGTFPPEAVRDLLVATITLKYTQSNSVGYALNGQMIGVGAGQQSRVDCVKLAGSKVRNWHLRFHPKVRGLPFKAGTKKVDKVNARVHFIENSLSPTDLELFTAPPSDDQKLSEKDKEEWLHSLKGKVSLSSDAFFPFRDSIDVGAVHGVKYVAQPGGRVAPEHVCAWRDRIGRA
eukprot:TRINITY_DN71_c0_g1_i2.p2 TRINITY_DN71_c0_g1~~TRINITY_DN71_c0_g1_i2.p2  ORF type:complete len:591 (+),score=243.89 TRINITY_DN71_c0_g1_i2:251-2023(+)